MTSRTPKPPSLRDWEVVTLRHGVGNKSTLQQIGEQIGVTRERVRQIIARALKFAENTMGTTLDSLEQSWNDHTQEDEKSDSKWGSNEQFLDWFQETASLSLDHDKLLTVLRGLSTTQTKETVTRWPELTFHSCLIEPLIRKHPRVNELCRRRSHHWTYIELAEHVLIETGEPLHWRDLIDRAVASGLRKDIYPSAMFNAVQAADEVFARIDSGTYGLKSWGLEDAPYFKELIRDVLIENGQPMTKGAIRTEVNKLRKIKASSLALYLDLDRMFYCSKSGEYGLREWLPPLHRQTISTPYTLVESPVSRRRLDS